MVEWLTALGLFLDIVGAIWIIAADLSPVRERMIQLDRRTAEIHRAKQHLLDDSQKRTRLTRTDRGFQGVSKIIEDGLKRQLGEDDIVEARGYGTAVGILENGERFSDPVLSRHFEGWIDDHYDRQFRSQGIQLLLLGFFLQFIAVVV